MLAGRQVRVQLCGRMCVQGDDGVMIDSSAFPGRQGRIVFACLVSTPQPVPREVLADLLWPERLPGAWRRDLAAVVSKLRALLARLGLDAADTLRGGGDSYQLVLSSRPEVDADAAVAWLAEAESAVRRRDLDGALAAAQAAAEVARRPFMAGETGDWVAQRQNALDGLLLAALEIIAEAAEPPAAVRAAQEASALRPLRETSHLKLIRAHLRAGDRAEALGVYARCRQLLAEELGVDPSPELQAAHLEALREPQVPQAVVRPPLPALMSPGDKGLFAGRRAELARLNDLLARAGPGPRMAYLCGDPGIGKTRLAAEFARAAYRAGAIVLAGRCDREQIVPYQPFAEALKHLAVSIPAGTLRAITGSWAPDLARLVPQLGDRLPGLAPPSAAGPETARYRLFEGVTAALVVLSRAAPVVLLIDDLQWADNSTLALLRHLMREPERAPLLIVAACRESEVSPGHPLTTVLADLHQQDLVTVVPVPGLDQSEVAAVLEGRAMLAAEVHQATAGNPFFVHQLVRHLIETGSQGLAGAGVPAGVHWVVRRRLALLGTGNWRALTVAAVIGHRFGAGLVGRVTGLGEQAALEALEGACAARLVTELPDGGGFAFIHDLVREAIYAQLGANRRALLHRATADGLEALAPGSAAELARHYLAAGPGARDKAVHYAIRAAEAAAAQLAHDEAARHYDDALSALPPGEPAASRGPLLLALGTARMRAGDPRARTAFHSAAAEARKSGDALLLARTALGVAATWAPTGTVDPERTGLLSEALTALPAGQDQPKAQLLSGLARARYWEADPAPRAQLSAQAVEIARRLGDPATLATCLDAHNSSIWAPGNAAARLGTAREIVALAASAAKPELAVHGHAWAITAAAELGDRDALDRELAAYAALADELRQPRYRWYARSRQAMRAIMTGDLDGGERIAADGRDIAGRAGEPDAENLLVAVLFPVWIERPDNGSTRTRLSSAIDSASNDRVRETLACARLLWETATGADPARYQAMLRLLGDQIAQPRDMHWAFNMACLASAAARQQDKPQAERLADALEPYAATGIVWAGAAAFFGSAAHWLGVLATTLGHHQQAEQYLATAMAFHERLGAAPWVARTHVERTRLLLATGSHDRALGLLADAGEITRRCGMSSLAADISSLTASHPEAATTPASPADDSLSPAPRTGR
jgi:DNA-binding SARP family transcriptional activator